jgi:hypothetical protein
MIRLNACTSHVGASCAAAARASKPARQTSARVEKSFIKRGQLNRTTPPLPSGFETGNH